MEALAVPPGRGGFSLSLHRLLDLHAAVLLQPFLGLALRWAVNVPQSVATLPGSFARAAATAACGVFGGSAWLSTDAKVCGSASAALSMGKLMSLQCLRRSGRWREVRCDRLKAPCYFLPKACSHLPVLSGDAPHPRWLQLPTVAVRGINA